jgi:hypothetical protein
MHRDIEVEPIVYRSTLRTLDAIQFRSRNDDGFHALEAARDLRLAVCVGNDVEIPECRLDNHHHLTA